MKNNRIARKTGQPDRRGGHREGAGRKPGVQNRRTTGDLADHRWAFDHAWSGSKPPRTMSISAKALLRFHQSLVAGTLRGNERAAVVSVERAFGRLPQPLEHSGIDGGEIQIGVANKLYVCEYSDGSKV